MVLISTNGSSFLTFNMSALRSPTLEALGRFVTLARGNKGNPRHRFLDSLTTHTYPSSLPGVSWLSLSGSTPFGLPALSIQCLDSNLFKTFSLAMLPHLGPFKFPIRKSFPSFSTKTRTETPGHGPNLTGMSFPAGCGCSSTERVEGRRGIGTRGGCWEHWDLHGRNVLNWALPPFWRCCHTFHQDIFNGPQYATG